MIQDHTPVEGDYQPPFMLHNSKGNSAVRQSRFMDAVKEYTMSIDLIPLPSSILRSKVYVNIGNSYFAAGDFQGALDSYLRSGRASAIVNTLVCCAKLRKGDQMRVIYRNLLSMYCEEIVPQILVASRILTRFESHAYVVDHLSSVDSQLAGRFEGDLCARQFITGRLGVDPFRNAMKGTLNEVFVSSVLDSPESVTDLAEAAFDAHPFEAHAAVNLANCLRISNPERSVALHEEAIRLSADCWQARASRVSLRDEGLKNPIILRKLSDFYLEQSDHLSTIRTLTALVSVWRNDADTLHRIGEIYDESLHNKLKAYKYFSESILVNPSHVKSLEWLALFSAEQEDWSTASLLVARLCCLCPEDANWSSLRTKISTHKKR